MNFILKVFLSKFVLCKYIDTWNLQHFEPILTHGVPAVGLLWLLLATLYPKKNGCANILRQKTLTLVNFTTQFSYFPGCSGYLVCCMTPEFVCVMIGSKKEIGTTLIDFLSNLVRCVYTWELTVAQFQIWYYYFIHFKNYECIHMEILTNRDEPTLWQDLRN